MLTIDYFGPDPDFVRSAFFRTNFFNQSSLIYSGGTPVEFSITNPDTGAITIVGGSGFTYDANGRPTGGIVTGIAFTQTANGGMDSAADYSGIAWDAVDWIAAAEGVRNFNLQPLWDLYALQDITVDASNALAGAKSGDIAPDYPGTITALGSDFGDTFFGADQNDTLRGEGGNDDLRGFSGADRFFGGDGNDSIQAGNGRDTAYGNNNDDVIAMGAGEDLAYGGTGNDVLRGGTGADRLFSQDGEDTLEGNAGDDEAYGGDGNDILRGAGGDDELYGGGSNDTIFGGNNRDTLYGSAGDDTLEGGAAQDTLYGSSDNDLLKAGSGDDTLDGGSGDDDLRGGKGRDLLIGGRGDDTMAGGAQNDTFVFDFLFGRDVITDFNANAPGEKIDLAAVQEIVDFADLAANHMAQVGADVVITEGANTITLLDTDLAKLDADDFLF